MKISVRETDDSALLLSGVLVGVFLWRYRPNDTLKLYQQISFWVSVLLVVCVVISGLLSIIYWRRAKALRLQPKKWAKMSGLQFKRQIAIWLDKSGYRPVSSTDYDDLGIDLIVIKDGASYGVKVKHSVRPVGVSTVRAAVSGLKRYACEQIMVVTNAGFTSQAKRLAENHDYRLIDGSELLRSQNR